MRALPPLNASRLAALAAVLLAALLYAPTLFAGLVTDDAVNYLNARDAPLTFRGLARGFRVGIEFGHDGVRPPGLADTATYFRPLTVLSFKADLALFGNRRGLYHLLNVALAAGTALLLLAAGRRLLGHDRAALLATLAFLAAPANAFTTAWLSSRTDLLATFFMAAALLPLLPAPRETPGSPGVRDRGLLSPALFALALLSKESAAPFPLAAYAALRAAGVGRYEAGIRIMPHLALLPFWWMIRSAHVGGFRLPDVAFYTLPPTDPWFPIYAAERLLQAFLTHALYFPPLPFKMLLPYPAWHGFVLLCLTPLAVAAWRGLFAPHPAPARRNAFLAGAFALTLPTIWFLPAPHYFHAPSLLFALALG